MPQASVETPIAEHRLVVESIGSASPGLAGVLASQLGMPTAQVANTLYKAPAVLLDRLPEQQARGLAGILAQAGLQIRVEPCHQPVPETATRLDIAVYLQDPDCMAECCARLARFLGCSPAAARNMLLAPPGVILGDVSQATVDALQYLLDDLPLELLCSARHIARYRLFIDRQPGSALNSLLGDLQRMGIEADRSATRHEAELDYQQGRYLWRRHQSGGGLRLMDTTFIRYDLTLEQTGPASCLEKLPLLAGLPADLIPCVIGNLPVVVEEGVRATQLEARLAAWADAGMPVRPQTVSLRCCCLVIEHCPQPVLCGQLLHQAGLLETSQSPGLPWRSPLLLGELLPRWLQSALDTLEAEYVFEDQAHGRD